MQFPPQQYSVLEPELAQTVPSGAPAQLTIPPVVPPLEVEPPVVPPPEVEPPEDEELPPIVPPEGPRPPLLAPASGPPGLEGLQPKQSNMAKGMIASERMGSSPQ